MTKELEEGKHGNASVLEFVQLELVEVGLTDGLHATFEVSEESPVVDGTDQEEDLDPTKGGDGLECGNTIGNILAGKTGGDVEIETVCLGGNVSKNGKHTDASVLDLGLTVLVEGCLIDVLGKSQGICKLTSGNKNVSLNQNMVNLSLKNNVPKKPVGAMTPSSFSYPLRLVERAFWEAGAKAEAAAITDAARMNFMVLLSTDRIG